MKGPISRENPCEKEHDLTAVRSILASVVGVDPGFAHAGIARALIVELDDGSRVIVPRALAVAATKPHVSRDASKKKTKAGKAARKAGPRSAASDMIGRVELIVRAIREHIDAADDDALPGVPVRIAAEAFSPTRQASASFKLACVWGGLTNEARHAGVDVWTITPKGLKRAITGQDSAEKDEVIRRVLAAYPKTYTLANEIKEADRNHAFDAFAAIYALARDEYGVK